MRTMTTTVYNFNELSEEAQTKAIEKNRDINVDYAWFDCVYEDAKTIAAIMGLEIEKIYFSGFYSQGDGACFVGKYTHKKGSVKAIKDYAPNDLALHQIAQNLADAQRNNFYKLHATVEHSGRYYHEHATAIDVYHGENIAFITTHSAIERALKDFMRWIYAQLRSHYEYLISDDAVKESILSNDYEFILTGERV